MNSFATPESIVRTERMGPHFTKYHLTSGHVLHHFKAANDKHFHDHPWPFRTSILHGGYVEEVAHTTDGGQLLTTTVKRLSGTSHEVKAGTIHKLTGLLDSDCWTKIEPGLKEREPGFYKANNRGVWHRFWYERKWKLIAPALHLL